jgi:iron complex outermembrane receptor protein
LAGGIGISKDTMALRNQHPTAAHPAQPHPLTDRRHGRRWRPRLSALAASLLLAGAAWAQTASPSVEKPIDIPAQALDKALGALARQTGQRIVFSTDLTEGKQAAALKGTLAPQQALERLLAGSGLVLKALPDGGFTVAPQPAGAEKETTLPVVRVKAAAEREVANGPVAGYVAKRSATGTKTDTPILETPQSTSVLGRDELETRGALSVLEALRYVPGVVTQVFGEDTRGQDDWLNLRGFSGFGTSLYQDGLRMNTDANAFANQRSVNRPGF